MGSRPFGRPGHDGQDARDVASRDQFGSAYRAGAPEHCLEVKIYRADADAKRVTNALVGHSGRR
jgi:hypothetical protein